MAAFINTNISSLNSQRNLSTSQGALTTSLQRLSSGLRINSAKDDAAGLAISERMTSQIRGNDQAARNANDGISLAQTAEGDMAQIGSNLQRMRELAVQSSNASNSESDRAALNEEAQQLSAEIDRVASSSSFNGVKLLDGSFNAQTFQIGANATADDRITISAIASARTSALGGSGTSTSTSVVGAPVSGTQLAAGDLTLNGLQVGASAVGASAGQSAGSAFSVAAAINAVSSQSGVNATAVAATVTGAAPTAGAVTAGSFSINGINVGAVASGGDAIGQGANTAAAINLVSGQSGVTATADDTGAITLKAADGRDITLAQNAKDSAGLVVAPGTALAATGVALGTKTGSVNLSSNSPGGITVSGGTIANAGLTAAAGNTAPSTTLSVNSIASVNLATSIGAQNALAAIDGALATVNSSRASLGAYQNRFSSVVSSLQTTSENLSASRSRIQDTDFAKETASLTRGQILQQAGTAMLAQANGLPNGVLALLRG